MTLLLIVSCFLVGQSSYFDYASKVTGHSQGQSFGPPLGGMWLCPDDSTYLSGLIRIPKVRSEMELSPEQVRKAETLCTTLRDNPLSLLKDLKSSLNKENLSFLSDNQVRKLVAYMFKRESLVALRHPITREIIDIDEQTFKRFQKQILEFEEVHAATKCAYATALQLKKEKERSTDRFVKQCFKASELEKKAWDNLLTENQRKKIMSLPRVGINADYTWNMSADPGK